MDATAVQSPPRHVSTKPQYLITYAVLGCMTPVLTLFLEQRGLSSAQAGYVWALAAVGTILTPIFITLLADTAIAGKYVMAAVFAIAGMCLALMIPACGFWPVAILYMLHSMAFRPVFPLQDGIHFAAQSQRAAMGLPQIPYHAVRVWGSVGYIIPCIVLYFFLDRDTPLTVTIYGGIACCAIGAVYAILFLPYTPAPARKEARSALPTAAAARAIAEPHVLVFCIAMFLVQVSSAAYYYGFPVQVKRCGLGEQWVGPITSLGVAIETLYILAFGKLVKWLTLRRLMYVGALTIAARMFLLAAFADPYTAIGTQVLHGLTVLVVHVAPPIYLNGRATDEYRNSIQGLYTMSVVGGGQMVGFFLTGHLAARGLALTFCVSGALGLVAMLLFFFAFREKKA